MYKFSTSLGLDFLLLAMWSLTGCFPTLRDRFWEKQENQSMAVRGGDQIQLKFYVVIGLDVRLPEAVLIFSLIAVLMELLAI